MDATEKRAVVDKYIQAVSTDDVELIKEIYSPDATVEDPVGSEPHQGIDAIVAFYKKAHGVGVKLELTGSVRCTTNACAFPFTAQTPHGTLHIIDTFEFNQEGKVTSMKAYWGA